LYWDCGWQTRGPPVKPTSIGSESLSSVLTRFDTTL